MLAFFSTIDQAIEAAEEILRSAESELKDRAQRNHPDIDAAPTQSGTAHLSLFMDGLGTMYDNNREVRDRVDALFNKDEQM